MSQLQTYEIGLMWISHWLKFWSEMKSRVQFFFEWLGPWFVCHVVAPPSCTLPVKAWNTAQLDHVCSSDYGQRLQWPQRHQGDRKTTSL